MTELITCQENLGYTDLAPVWSSFTTLAELTSKGPLSLKARTIASAILSPCCCPFVTATHVGPAPLIVQP